MLAKQLSCSQRGELSLVGAALTLALASVPVFANPVPENIDYGNVIAEDENFLYYASARDWDTEICHIKHYGVIYGRVPHGGGAGDREQLTVSCDAIRPQEMVMTPNYVYFTEQAPADPALVYRAPIDGSGAPELLHTAASTAIATDGDYVYYFATSGVMRFSADAPYSTEFVGGYIINGTVNDLEHTDGWLLWTEAHAAGGGAIQTVPAAGGAVALLEATAGTPWDLTYGDNYIYWSELEGKILRREQATGVTSVIYDQLDPVYDLDLAGDLLAFTQGYDQSGTIWRMEEGGGPATLVAFDQSAPRNVTFANGYVYWNTLGQVKRLPDDAEATPPDYIVDRMEVTQAVQDGVHDIPMVLGKATYVRVYSREATGAGYVPVTAHLHGFRDGVELPNSPISPYGPQIDPQGDVVLRSERLRTLSFALPEDWVRGDLSLQVEINPVVNGDRRYETDYGNNTFPAVAQQTVSLHTSELCITSFRVAAHDNDYNELIYDHHSHDYALQLERSASLLAAHVIPVFHHDTLRPEDGTSFYMPTDFMDLLATVNAQASWTEHGFVCDDARQVFMGLIHPDAPTEDSGAVLPDTNSGWSKMLLGTNYEPYNQPAGGVTLAHEALHAVGFDHVECGSQVDGPFADYPYDPCKLGGSDDEEAPWGFDGISREVLDPLGTYNGDLMTYETNQWVSDWTWNELFLDLYQPARVQRMAPSEQVLWVSGTVGRAEGGLMLDPAFHFPAEQMTPLQRQLYDQGMEARAPRHLHRRGKAHGHSHEHSDGHRHERHHDHAAMTELDGYVLEALDERGRVLHRQPVVAQAVVDGSPSPTAHFLAVLPWSDGTAQLRLSDSLTGSAVALQPGAHSPALSVAVTPGDEQLEVAVHASDSDRDALEFVYQYSPDGGMTWTALATGTPVTEFTVDTTRLAGSEAITSSLVRAYASDGLNTVSALSAPFEVSRKAPSAFIASPKSGEVIAHGEGVLLRGLGVDPECCDRAAGEGLHYSWILDEESVGLGRWVTVEGLAPGWHSATLQVMDQDQMIGTRAVRFEVR
ncbi:MAG: hypothetical protein AAGA68_24595 [Pseudomonadota bacterium]